MPKTKVFLILAILTISAGLFSNINSAKAQLLPLCSIGGDVTINISCEINGAAAYNNLTITGIGTVVTSGAGQKIDITAAGKVQIDPGAGIDVSGKGDNITGKGADGGSNGSACNGVWGSGGGGGGYGGAGGTGGNDILIGGAGGGTYGSNTNPSDLGSPGGLGGGNGTGNGMGGGAVKIQAKQIILNGFIKANGTNGSDPRGNDGSGGGGGGSGGSIWLLASTSFDFTGGAIEAKGGDGGVDVNCVCPPSCPAGGWDGSGGGGGGGRISLQYNGPKIGIGIHNESFGPGGAGPAPGANGANGTFYEDPCYQKVCDDYCAGLMAYFNGTCDPVTGNCDYALIEDCDDTISCTSDFCDKGVCSNENSCGGLVPCGRRVDDPTTNLDETQSCTICHIFVLVKRIVDFALLYVLFPLMVIGLIATGVSFIGAAGNRDQINTAKGILMFTFKGVFLALAAWLIIQTIVMVLVPNSRPWKSWMELICPVAPCDSDGTCETTGGNEDSQNCPTDCPCDFNDICDLVREQIGVIGVNPQACPDCAVCGNNIRDIDEECDGNDYGPIINQDIISAGGRICQIVGNYSSGTFGCTSECKIDKTGCVR